MNSNNKMDIILNQLENKSLPNLTKQDEHWCQLKMILQSDGLGVRHKTNFLKKYFWWVTIFIATIGISFYKYKLASINARENVSPIKETTIQKVVRHQTDTIPSEKAPLKSNAEVNKEYPIIKIKSSLNEVKSTPVGIIKDASYISASSTMPVKDTVYVLATGTKTFKDTAYVLATRTKTFKDTTYSSVIWSGTLKDTSYSSVIYSMALKDTAYSSVIGKTYKYPSDTASIRYRSTIIKDPLIILKDSIVSKKDNN